MNRALIEELYNVSSRLHQVMLRFMDVTEYNFASKNIENLAPSDVVKMISIMDLACACLITTQVLTTKASYEDSDAAEFEEKLCDLCNRLAARRVRVESDTPK